MSERKADYLLFDLSQQIFDIIAPEESVRQISFSHPRTTDFINALADNENVVDAIRFLAVAINKRQSIWWALVVNERFEATKDQVNPVELKAWSLVREWVYSPTEANRVAAYEAAEALDFQTAGSYAALAVFWSGGNILPPHAQEILLPPPQLCCSAVGASILLTCADGPATDTPGRQREAVKIGLGIASGNTGLGSGGSGNDDAKAQSRDH
jgi:hypothetical protein